MGIHFLGRSIEYPAPTRRCAREAVGTGSFLRIGVLVIGMLVLTLTKQPLAGEAQAIGVVAVIVNPNGPLVSATEADIRAIYLGERQFVKGEMIVPLHLSDGLTKTTFLSAVVGKSPKEYKLHWLQRVFQGTASLPNTVAGPDVMVAAVASQRNTVGYVPSFDLKDNKQVAVLFMTTVP